MTITKTPGSSRVALAAASILILVGVSSCGAGSSSSSASSTPTNDAPSRSTTSSASLSPSASAATTQAPVPVESNPPGDIPDNLAFVPYTNKVGGFSFTHPEGWARTGHGVRVRFTDKLNGVAVTSLPAAQAPTVSSARSVDVTRLKRSVPAFQLRGITAVSVPGGKGARIVFRRNSDPDAVTGKVYRDEVEEYLVFSAGRLVRMDLYGPVGADNVDAYRTMSQSLRVQ